MALEAVY